jgi:hypothetical protein
MCSIESSPATSNWLYRLPFDEKTIAEAVKPYTRFA